MIRITPIRLIGQDGEQVGIIETSEALRMAQEAGLDLVDLTPNVIAGGPGTEVFQWGHDFFNSENQLDNMQKRGGLTDEDRATFKEQWPKLCEAPGAMFYSPIVLDAAGRRSNG